LIGAAVEAEDLAGGVGELVVEVVDEGGDDFRGVEVGHDVFCEDVVAALGGDGAGHGCFHEAGEDGVDADAVRAVGVGEVAGEA